MVLYAYQKGADISGSRQPVVGGAVRPGASRQNGRRGLSRRHTAAALPRQSTVRTSCADEGTQGRWRETQAGQLPAKRPRRRSTIAGFARRLTGRRKPVNGYTYAGGRSLTSRWIVRPAPRCTRAAWTSAAVWTACSRRCFSVS